MSERCRTLSSTNYFSNLADEVVIQIFRDLAQRDLATLRSLCHQFARCGRDLLYTDFTFSPTDRSVDAFLYVTRHPDFHQHVRHFIYDDSQLVRNLTYRIHFEKVVPASYIKSPARRDQAFNEYCRLFREQQQILDGLSNLLLQGLPRLSRLEKLSVVGGPSRSPNCLFKGGARTDGFASTVFGLSYWSYQHKSKYQFMERKGVHDLIKALSQPGIRLRKIHIGNWSEREHRVPLKMGLPLSSLSLPDPGDNTVLMTSTTSAFANVTDLNLQIDGRGRTQGHHYSVPDLENLFVMLPAMHRLSRLSLGFTHLVLHADETKRLVTSIERHTLIHLRLRSIRFYVDDMIRLFFNHQTTLTEVSFIIVGLVGSKVESWTTLVESVDWFTNIELRAFIECFEWRTSNEITRVGTGNGEGKRFTWRLGTSESLSSLVGK